MVNECKIADDRRGNVEEVLLDLRPSSAESVELLRNVTDSIEKHVDMVLEGQNANDRGDHHEGVCSDRQNL